MKKHQKHQRILGSVRTGAGFFPFSPTTMYQLCFFSFFYGITCTRTIRMYIRGSGRKIGKIGILQYARLCVEFLNVMNKEEEKSIFRH